MLFGDVVGQLTAPDIKFFMMRLRLAVAVASATVSAARGFGAAFGPAAPLRALASTGRPLHWLTPLGVPAIREADLELSGMGAVRLAAAALLRPVRGTRSLRADAISDQSEQEELATPFLLVRATTPVRCSHVRVWADHQASSRSGRHYGTVIHRELQQAVSNRAFTTSIKQ